MPIRPPGVYQNTELVRIGDV